MPVDMTERRSSDDSEDTPTEQAVPAEGIEDYGGPHGYPVDPGAAFESEPEPADESFSEHSHWVGRSDDKSGG